MIYLFILFITFADDSTGVSTVEYYLTDQACQKALAKAPPELEDLRDREDLKRVTPKCIPVPSALPEVTA